MALKALKEIKLNNSTSVVSVNEDFNEYNSAQKNDLANSIGILKRLRGQSSEYRPGLDPIFYCGRFSGESSEWNTVIYNMLAELNKLHANIGDGTYTCTAAEVNNPREGEYRLPEIRPIPIGLCQINLYGSHIWFINNVKSYIDDQWSQIFLNAGVLNVEGIKCINNGNDIVIRQCNGGVWGDFKVIKNDIADIIDAKANAANVYNKTDSDNKFATKTQLNNDYYNKAKIDTELSKKSDASNTYTRDEINSRLNTKANNDNVYNRETIDTKLNNKANVGSTLANYGITDGSHLHIGQFNSGNITEEGWYDSINSGRPAGCDNDELFLLYHSPSDSQICFSKKYSGNIYHRITKEATWVKLPLTHIGEFNANDITEEGWYDSITLSRPEGSESDEKYFLYHSSNGGQICFSRRNSGKAYHRLGINKPEGGTYLWEPLSRDNYTLQRAVAMSMASYVHSSYITYDSWLGTTQRYDGYGYKEYQDEQLSEMYSGYWEVLSNKIHLYKQVHLKPNDIIKLRCFYRWSEPGESYPQKYNSDAYIYVNDITDLDHSIDHLKSDFIKISSLGSFDVSPLPDSPLRVRQELFTEDKEYGWHYIKINVNVEGDYYLHIAGDFTDTKSWLIVGEGEILSQSKSSITEIRDVSAITPTAGTYTSENNFVPGTYILRYGNVNWKGGDSSRPTSVIYPLTKSTDEVNEFYWYKKAKNLKYTLNAATISKGYSIDENTGIITCPPNYDDSDLIISVNVSYNVGNNSFTLPATQKLTVRTAREAVSNPYDLKSGWGSSSRDMDFPWDPQTTDGQFTFTSQYSTAETFFRSLTENHLIGNIITKYLNNVVRASNVYLSYIGSNIEASDEHGDLVFAIANGAGNNATFNQMNRELVHQLNIISRL